MSNPNFYEIYNECDCTMDRVIDELAAIQELIDTPERQELHLSEGAREGLAHILARIVREMSTAQCDRPTAEELRGKVDELAAERTAINIVENMAGNIGRTPE